MNKHLLLCSRKLQPLGTLHYSSMEVALQVFLLPFDASAECCSRCWDFFFNICFFFFPCSCWTDGKLLSQYWKTSSSFNVVSLCKTAVFFPVKRLAMPLVIEMLVFVNASICLQISVCGHLAPIFHITVIITITPSGCIALTVSQSWVWTAAHSVWDLGHLGCH